MLTAAEAPEAVRRLLKSYDVAALKWAESDHRYAIVREILVRGDDEAARWLHKILRLSEIRELVRRYRGAGCSEPERQKLRKEFRLTVDDIPSRPYLGFKWPDHA
jgi:ribosomal protein L15E